MLFYQKNLSLFTKKKKFNSNHSEKETPAMEIVNTVGAWGAVGVH
jgi:hypothetical protein